MSDFVQDLRSNGGARGHAGGRFGHTIGLVRFEPGALAPWLRIPDDEPLLANLSGEYNPPPHAR